MTNRSAAVLLIAVGLAVYGVYIAGYVPGLLVGRPMPLVLICFVLQAMLALVGAVGVWRGQRWAPGVVMLLGVVTAVTWLIDAFVLGIVAYLHALLVAVLAVVVAALLAMYVGRQRGSRIG
jgi:hypothetical protein